MTLIKTTYKNIFLMQKDMKSIIFSKQMEYKNKKTGRKIRPIQRIKKM